MSPSFISVGPLYCSRNLAFFIYVTSQTAQFIVSSCFHVDSRTTEVLFESREIDVKMIYRLKFGGNFLVVLLELSRVICFEKKPHLYHYSPPPLKKNYESLPTVLELIRSGVGRTHFAWLKWGRRLILKPRGQEKRPDTI